MLRTKAAQDRTPPYLSSSLQATPQELMLLRLLPVLHTLVPLPLPPQLPVPRTLQQLQLQPPQYLPLLLLLPRLLLLLFQLLPLRLLELKLLLA